MRRAAPRADTTLSGAIASGSASGYRADIDGMRAVAVLAVLINHLDETWLPSGYLGVDVFFVISGFVITGALQPRRDEPIGRFLSLFYARRFRRILGALLASIALATLLAALLVARPELSLRTGQYAVVGMANVSLWWSAASYFDPSSELNLLMHTWSLGVEEQFYLLYPLVFWLCSRGAAPRARTLIGLGAILAASLWWSIHQHMTGHDDAAFYLLPARAWELGCGAAAFLALPTTGAWLERQWWHGAMSWAGAALLAATFWQPPSAASTMLAAAATTLLIHGGAEALPQRVLSSKPLVYLGLRSYSIYLYHWILISTAHWTVGVNARTAPWLVAATGALAWASYQYVERPLRYGRPSLPPRAVIAWSLGAMAVAAASLAGMSRIAGQLYLGRACRPEGHQTCVPASFPHTAIAPYVSGTGITRQACFADLDDPGGVTESKFRRCSATVSTRRPTLFVFGDSYAGHLTPALELLHQRDRVNLVVLVRGRCSFDLYAGAALSEACRLDNRDRLQLLRAHARSGDALLVAGTTRHTVAPSNLQTLGELAVEFAARGVSVLVQYPLPDVFGGGAVPAACSDSAPTWFNRGALASCDAQFATPLATHLARTSGVAANLAALQRHTTLHVWTPHEVLCPNGVCRSHLDEVRVYRDERSHLSDSGARTLYPSLRAALAAASFAVVDAPN